MRHGSLSWLLFASSIYSSSALGQAVDPRGPIAAYSGVQVTPQGVSLSGKYAVLDKKGPSGKQAYWTPQWIALPDNGNRNVSAVRFRKEFVLPIGSPIASAQALVTADPFYRLWVNGHLVSRGPDDAGRDYSPPERWSHQWLANRVVVTRYLQTGANVIAAEVFPHHQNLSRGTTGFALQLKVLQSRSSEPLLIETGPDWRVQDATAYSNGPVAQGKTTESEALLYDGRNDETGWRDVGFATTNWLPARVLDSIWGPVAVSNLPPMMEAVFPSSRISTLDDGPLPPRGAKSQAHHNGIGEHESQSWLSSGNGRFLVDYDRVLSGYISLKLEGTSGSTVTVWPRELRTDAPGRRPFVVILGKGTTFFESPSLESFSSLEIDVSNAAGPVNFRDVRANFVSQPVAYRGDFTSSDERLNTLWRASRWQTQICLQNRFMDSPDHQEPIGDPGDYLIEAKVADYAFGPAPLTPQFLRQFAAILDHWMVNHPEGSPNFHTSYSLLWLQTLLEYYDETGNESLAKELAPSAYRLLARYAQWIGPNGILSEAPNYLFMDWVTIGGFPTHHPPAVIGQGYLTAFYYRGLADGIRLAQLTGDTTRVAQYMEQRSQLRRAFHKELWDARVGLYRDGKPFLNHNPTSPNFLPPDKNIETHSPHVNVLAVLYDLAPLEEQSDILARVFASEGATAKTQPGDRQTDSDGLLNVQPYFMHFVFAAEAHAGLFAKYAPAQLARWTVNPQTQTFQEMWTRGDWSHGWGATPLIQMSARVLGVSADSPGYATVLLAPNPIGLNFAKGTVPTPKGDVQVSWIRELNRFVYDVTLPPRTGGTIDLAGFAGAGAILFSIDGSQSMRYSRPIRIGAGAHRLILSSRTASETK